MTFMNNLNKILFGLAVLSLYGCASDDFIREADLVGGEGKAVFSISTSSDPIVVDTRSGEETPATITGMDWLLSDIDGNIIDHHYGRFENQYTKFTIDGLKKGKYMMIFLASLSENSDIEMAKPATMTDPWLINSAEGKAINALYCYKKVPFSVGDGSGATEVILEHKTARVNVDLAIGNPTLWRNIKKVTVTFNEELPSALNAGGDFSGSQRVADFDITDPRGNISFTTFPSDLPVSGYVEIESTLDDGGDSFIQRYDFSDLTLESGKIAHINIAYRHPEAESGLLRVTPDEFWRFNPSTMLMADEPREVFYDNSIRWFYADQPLQITVTSDAELGIKFYSPIPIKDIKIRGLFNKHTTEWVELALIDELPAFTECYIPLPVKAQDCVFKGESGRKVRIPANPQLGPADLALKYECDDPFMQKISTIDSHWFVRFSPYQTDQGHAYWRHMDPLLCRHAIALALNMAYMFASPEFSEELDKYDGILHDNSGNPIDLEALRNTIRRHPGLRMGRVVGVGGLGGGETYGLADYCYTGVYHNNTPEGQNPHNYARQAMFHEYGHCLGYGHSSNMTYGDCWTVICAKIFVELGRAGKLPVSNITDVTMLPME